MSFTLFEFSLGHCYEHCTTKNVVNLTFFRKIVIKTQCIDCGNDHFWCQFDKIWNFLNVSHVVWIFTYGTVMNIVGPNNVVHLTFFRKIVIETQFKDSGKWSTFDANSRKTWNFLNVSHICLNFHLRALLWTFLGPKM